MARLRVALHPVDLDVALAQALQLDLGPVPEIHVVVAPDARRHQRCVVVIVQLIEVLAGLLEDLNEELDYLVLS